MNEVLLNKLQSAPFAEWVSGLRRDNVTYDWCDALPLLPNETFQRRFVGRAFGDAMQQAIEFVELSKTLITDLGGTFHNDNRIVDFGCGWGRISQTLYRYFNPSNVISVDIQEDAITFCKQSGLKTKLYQIDDQKQNLHMLADSSVNSIIAFSVFSHLTEELANKWMREFYRVLSPGGSVAITTRHISLLRHVEHLKTLPNKKIPPHAYGLLEAFANAAEANAEFEAGHFVYRSYPNMTKCGDGYSFVPCLFKNTRKSQSRILT